MLAPDILMRCESPIEREFFIFIEPHIERIKSLGFNIVAQHEVENYRLDFAFIAADGRLVAVELDGLEHHAMTQDQFERDRKRDRFFVLSGWRVLRFTGREIRHQGASCASEVMLHLQQISPLSGDANLLAAKIANRQSRLANKAIREAAERNRRDAAAKILGERMRRNLQALQALDESND